MSGDFLFGFLNFLFEILFSCLDRRSEEAKIDECEEEKSLKFKNSSKTLHVKLHNLQTDECLFRLHVVRRNYAAGCQEVN
jgi:hypothetical protein